MPTNTSKKLRFIMVAICLLCFSIYTKASDDQKWYEDRDEALAAAKEEKKYVLLLYGRTGCANCSAAKKFISELPLNQIVEENFILWFCDIDKADTRAQGSAYRDYFDEPSIILPLLCTINPYNPVPALSYSTGYRSATGIETILINNLPTANEEITALSSYAYLADNILTISNEIINETIHIYTVTGLLIDSFGKNDYTIVRNTSFYPKGVLVVSSSQGWSIKILHQRFR